MEQNQGTETEFHLVAPYSEVFGRGVSLLPNKIFVEDHLLGFGQDGSNLVFDRLSLDPRPRNIVYHNLLPSQVHNRYTNLQFSFKMFCPWVFDWAQEYNVHPEVRLKKFICSFNGTPHISRMLLVAHLKNRQWFDAETCSKNFVVSADDLDNHVFQLTGRSHRLISKFFKSNCVKFDSMVNSFGHNKYDHISNIHLIDDKITQSFVHLVSESMATSYVPFVTEKFLYSVVTRGLFVAFAQPGWHAYLSDVFGFKRYDKIFNYAFDDVQDPLHRCLAITDMLSRFANLGPWDWHDLYQMETDTIEYNYDHYFSGNYMRQIKTHEH